MKIMKVMKLVLATLVIFSMNQAASVTATDIQGLNLYYVPELVVTNSSLGGTLLLSDSPEMVTHDGILYQDKIEGNARLFFYHVNAAQIAKKMDVVLENKNKETAHVTVSQFSLGGPGYDWMAVGKEALSSYLAGSRPYQLNIPPGGSVSLSADISAIAVLPNMLINGIYDFTADRQITVKVLMMSILDEGVEFAKIAQLLPADQYRLRGTFEGANRQLAPLQPYDPTRDGAVTLTLADNAIDHYLQGIDATDGTKVINYGNYGVVYHIQLPSQGSGKIAYYLLPAGGSYAGAIGIKHPEVNWSPLAIPLGRKLFGDNKAVREYAFLGTYDSGDPLSLTFSPPGGSNLPVVIVVLPQ